MIVGRRQWILDRCTVGERIIDIGSANGWIWKSTTFWGKITCIDLDLYDIPNFYRMNAEHLEFPDKSFDVSILGEVLEHTTDPIQTLKEAKRVSKRILMTIPNEAEWDQSLFPFETIEQGMRRRNLTLEEIAKVSNPDTKEFYTKDNYDHLFHHRYYTESTLKRDLEFAGIKDYKLETLRYNGWCTLPNTPILTLETGVKKIKNIKVGNKVLTHKGRWRKVSQVMNRNYNGDMIEIVPKKLRIPLVLTPEHRVLGIKTNLCHRGHGICIPGRACYYTKNGKKYKWCKYLKGQEPFTKYKTEWIRSCDLKVGDLLIYPRYREKDIDINSIRILDYIDEMLGITGDSYEDNSIQTDLFGEYIDKTISSDSRSTSHNIPANVELTKDLMRLFGYFIAEGDAGNGYLDFAFNINENEYIQDVEKLMKYIFGLDASHIVEGQGYDTHELRYYDKILSNMFRNMFCPDEYRTKRGKGSKANIVRIPGEFLNLPKDKLVEIVKGIWRGDGGKGTKGTNRYDIISTTSETLAHQLIYILAKFEMLGSLRMVERNYPRENFFVVSIFGTDIDIFDKIICKKHHFRQNLEDKYVSTDFRQSYIKGKNSYLVPIEKIKIVKYNGNIFNLEVEEDNSFVCPIAVHNSFFTVETNAKELDKDELANCNNINTNNKNLDIIQTLPFRPNDKIMELGGGANSLFHPNYDIRQLPNVDYIIDLNDPNLPISSDSCDGIYSRYLLEHINWRNVKRFLTETYRILKPNGNIVLITANLLEQAKVLVDTQQWNNDIIGMIFGAEDYKENTHQCGFSPQYITEILTDTGFKDIKIIPINSDFGPTDMEIRAVKPDKSDNISEKIKEVEIKEIEQKPIITQGPVANWNILTEGKNEQNQDSQIYNSDKKLIIALISTPFFTVPPSKYGGLEQIVWDLAEALDELGHEVTLFAPEGSRPTKRGHLVITGPSYNTVNIDWFQAEKNAYEKYKDIIIPDRYDIIHSHNWFAFPYLLKGKYPNLKVLHTQHGGFSWETAPPFPKPNLVAISNYMKLYTEQYFHQRGYNIHSEYVHNGIDLEKYPFQSTKSDSLLFVGRLSTFKQPHIAVEVARKTNHKLDIVGGTFVDSTEYVNRLDKMVENDPNIKIYKDTTHEFKIEKMQNAKALIFPSRMNEPLGLVAQEAMSCGTPVIATRDGAIPEIVLHSKTGFICDTEEEMVEAVKNIDKIDPLKCRKHVEDNFSRLKMAENYVKLYKRILKGDEW